MKKIALLLLTVTLILILPGCKKLVEGLIPTIPTDSIPTVSTPTLTDVGTPVGDVITKVIGKTGGSIASADGNAELIFPADALNDNTSISIQAVTQTAPNGVGYGYEFLPQGIHFLQPVTLKFHYTADDLASTLGDLMGIAFQDSIGGWWRVNDFTNDTINKIISAPIKHFTVYTPFDVLFINPPRGTVQVGTSISIKIDVVDADDDNLTTLGSNDFVAPLITLNKNIVWSVNGVVNGNSTFGTITGNLLNASFKAPAKVPSQNPVAVSAKVDVNFKYHGKTFGKTSSASLVSNVRIVDEEVYIVEMKLLDTVVDNAPDYIIVWDSVSMKVTIRGETVTVSEITNFASKANPSQIVGYDDATYFVPDPVGEINITSATGNVGPYIYANAPDDRMLGLKFVQTGTHDPKTHYLGPNGYSDYSGGDPNQGYPLAWLFELLPDGEPAENTSQPDGLLAKVMDVKITLQK